MHLLNIWFHVKENGVRIFYPFGLLGTGYVLDSNTNKKILLVLKILGCANFILGSVIFVLLIIGIDFSLFFLIGIIFLFFLISSYFFVIKRILKGAHKIEKPRLLFAAQELNKRVPILSISIISALMCSISLIRLYNRLDFLGFFSFTFFCVSTLLLFYIYYLIVKHSTEK